MLGIQSGINVIGALIYPTSLRANGPGWQLGIGRLGAVVCPLIGPLFVGLPVETLYIWSTIPFAAGAAVTFLIYLLNRARLRAAGASRTGAGAMTATLRLSGSMFRIEPVSLGGDWIWHWCVCKPQTIGCLMTNAAHPQRDLRPAGGQCRAWIFVPSTAALLGTLIKVFRKLANFVISTDCALAAKITSLLRICILVARK